MEHRPTVDRALCIGAGNCEYRAPNTFQVGADGISQVLDPRGDDDQSIQSAHDECPSAAIELIDDEP